MAVPDTGAAVWWTLSPELLSRRAAREIAAAEHVGVPSIVFREVAMLAHKQRLALDIPVNAWADAILQIPRVRCLPSNASAALAADAFEMHPDPADRFIVAVTLESNAILLTNDQSLRKLKIVRTAW